MGSASGAGGAVMTLLLDTTNPPQPADKPMDHRQQPKKRDRGPIPARQGNGYYADHTTGDRLRSVTTILSGGIPKDGLIHWAGNTCTDSAIENLPALVAASRHPERLAEMRDWIRRAHTRKKEERAEVGSAVHAIIESRILGTHAPSRCSRCCGTGEVFAGYDPETGRAWEDECLVCRGTGIHPDYQGAA